ncbi:serine hydrolase domain-containing protein [Paenibacillus thalictri]|uniref:Penicillin-binding protein n=1 Tax=Paenibacillus thalictri TaxID=2527873 RepID=A0A4Q9DTU2_9BACL|nr:serine hydrolase [Paenibacillus thalictri]TBL80366.1 penicillin-binding protein [Paenibacillus thalictri]
METTRKLVESWISEKLIPGAVLDVSLGRTFRVQLAFGSYHDGTSEAGISLDTLFDAASLTKVTATLPAVLTLAAQGKLDFDDAAYRYVPQLRHPKITIRHLLQHTSGLPADLPHVDRSVARDVKAQLFEQELQSEPGERAAYSDLGMILLGMIVEQASGEPLEQYVSRAVFKPLDMTESLFNPWPGLKPRIAATEPYGSGYVHGEVHDEKCFQLGGISGSAGLFTTADNLQKYAACWLNPQKYGLWTEQLADKCVKDPVQGRGLGWEVWNGQPEAPSCGELWTHGSFGHTGFTGTSLWMDPLHQLSVVFLTNAVHFGRKTPIRSLRKLLHSSIYRELLGHMG